MTEQSPDLPLLNWTERLKNESLSADQVTEAFGSLGIVFPEGVNFLLAPTRFYAKNKGTVVVLSREGGDFCEINFGSMTINWRMNAPLDKAEKARLLEPLRRPFRFIDDACKTLIAEEERNKINGL